MSEQIGSVLLGAVAARMQLDREARAAGLSLNARGATGIAIVVMALSRR